MGERRKTIFRDDVSSPYIITFPFFNIYTYATYLELYHSYCRIMFRIYGVYDVVVSDTTDHRRIVTMLLPLRKLSTKCTCTIAEEDRVYVVVESRWQNYPVHQANKGRPGCSSMSESKSL
jgi:hypothetical protein